MAAALTRSDSDERGRRMTGGNGAGRQGMGASRMTVRTVAAAMLASILVASCHSAEKAQQKADANAAGFVPPSVLSRLDYGGIVERRFHTLDRNGDQKIDKDEMPRSDSQLMALDLDKDGNVSAIEWSEGMIGRFDKMDANHDGTVTSEERQAGRRQP